MSSTRKLWPREHGAYAELCFPLLTALLLATPSLAAVAIAAAAVVTFLANEPLLVLVGARGSRRKRTLGAAARSRLALLSTLAALFGGLGLALAPLPAQLALVLPALLGAAVVGLALVRQEKSLGGELLVAAALSSTLIPVALASGADLRPAVGAALVWAVTFTLQTVAVHACKARGNTPRAPWWTIPLSTGLAGLTFLSAIGAATLHLLPLGETLALTPTALAVLVMGAIKVRPGRLKAIGWTFVGAAMASTAALLTL